VYTLKNTHTLYKDRSFAVRQRDLAERKLHRRVAVWRSFLYHVRRVVCLRRTLTGNAWSVSNSRQNSYLSIAWIVKKSKESIEARRETREISRVDRDRLNVQILFFYHRASFPLIFSVYAYHFFGPFEHSKTLVSLFFLSICRAPCIRFRAK